MWIVVALGGCAPQGLDTGAREWDGDFLVDEVVIDCDGYYEWTYDVVTIGWGRVVTVDVVANDPFLGRWEEHHELPEVDYGDGWAQHVVELDQEADPAAYADSVSTIIACDAKTYVTYAFTALPYEGEPTECITWGIDPEGEFPDCVSWGTASH